MEYFDSKVLESFMIPEYDIATEGFGSKIIELGRKAINFLIAMITKLISILGYLINRFKHGKTVDIDGDTFAESVRLHGVIINELYYLLNNIPSQIYSLSYTASVISPSSIDEGFNEAIITNILELKYLDYLGVMPIINSCAICGSKTAIATISSEKGGYICNNCLSTEKIVSDKAIKLIRMFYYVNISQISTLNISSNVEKEINDFLDDYYDRYTGLYLKTKKFLKNLRKIN